MAAFITTIHSCPKCDRLHSKWNREERPALKVAPGDTFRLVCPDSSNGMLTRTSTEADIAKVDFRQTDPLCGPVHVDGAVPGDALRVELIDVELAEWGWTGLLPDFGLLADEFPTPYFRSFDLTPGHVDIFGERFALKAFMGVLGVAPDLDGDFSAVPPTRAGGNIDVRYLTRGSIIYLPVLNEGALLSGGDGHALQGEGEISGCAIEAPMTATLKVDVIKNRRLPAPMIDCSTRPYDETEYRDFLGVGPDLMTAAKDSARFAVDELSHSLGVAPHEAYAILGMVGELRIHEIVDQPNWVVGCMIPRRLFGGRLA
jgi:acetamidase/formamidase